MRTTGQLGGDYTRFFPARDWNQNCQAAVAWLSKYTTGRTPTFYRTARDAYEASQIVSVNPARARLNDVHYWAIGYAWHVAVELGGGRVLMASKHTDQTYGVNLGTTTIAAYGRATGAVYRGFAHSNGLNRINIAAPRSAVKGSARVRRNAAWLNRQGYGRQTEAARDGIVDQTGRVPQVYWWLVQEWGRRHGKYGAAYRHDGIAGTQTRRLEKQIDALAAKAAA